MYEWQHIPRHGAYLPGYMFFSEVHLEGSAETGCELGEGILLGVITNYVQSELTFMDPGTLLLEDSKMPSIMGVSENSDTPKSSILTGFSIKNHPFWGTPIFGNTHMYPFYLYSSADPWIHRVMSLVEGVYPQ